MSILWRTLQIVGALTLLVLGVAVIALTLSDYGTVGFVLGCLLLVAIIVTYLQLRNEVRKRERGNEKGEVAPRLTHARAFGLILMIAGGVGSVASAAFADGLVAALLIAIFLGLLVAGCVVRVRGHYDAAISRAVRLRRGIGAKD